MGRPDLISSKSHQDSGWLNKAGIAAISNTFLFASLGYEI
jgi:hypothetical protein